MTPRGLQPTVIEPDGHGHWVVLLPGDPPQRIQTTTRRFAEHIAFEDAAREVVIRDAYHRVVSVRPAEIS